MGYLVRTSRPGDEGALKQIWQTVFGDGKEYVDCFFEYMYTPGKAFVCEDSGKIVSAVHLLDIGEFASDGKVLPATVLYAFTTLPDCRGNGIGGMVSDMLLEASAETFQTVCPAEKSLFDYYERRYGYKAVFSVSEERFDSVPETVKRVTMIPLTASEYGENREKWLSTTAHIRYNDRALNYQHRLCKNSGGDMVSFKLGTAEGIAAYEAYDGCAVFKEVLCASGGTQAALAIAGSIGAGSAVVRTPAGRENVRPFAMAMTEKSINNAYFGFAFD